MNCELMKKEEEAIDLFDVLNLASIRRYAQPAPLHATSYLSATAGNKLSDILRDSVC
jgi:hypothetical protein